MLGHIVEVCCYFDTALSCTPKQPLSLFLLLKCNVIFLSSFLFLKTEVTFFLLLLKLLSYFSFFFSYNHSRHQNINKTKTTQDILRTYNKVQLYRATSHKLYKPATSYCTGTDKSPVIAQPWPKIMRTFTAMCNCTLSYINRVPATALARTCPQ